MQSSLPVGFPIGDFELLGMSRVLSLGVVRRWGLCMLLLVPVLPSVLGSWTVVVVVGLDCPGVVSRKSDSAEELQRVWFVRVYLGISLVPVSGRGENMMLLGGSFMIICKMGHSFMTGWELAECRWSSKGPHLQACVPLIHRFMS